MICLVCARLRAGESGSACSECGAPLVPITEPHVEALIHASLRRRIHGWHTDALIDEATATRLEQTLAATPAPEVQQAPVAEGAPEVVAATVVAVSSGVDPATRAEAWAEGLATSLRRVFDWRPDWGGELARSLDAAAKAEQAQEALRRERARTSGDDASEDDLGSALGSGQALFTRDPAGALSGGLEAMVALDADPERAPKLHEYIWWFLGAVLVLGGSLMGVREAWRALGGVPRQLLVSGALLGYHAAFIGLGTFLGRRSLPVGRVLAGIGLALLPVVFVALSSLVALWPALGLAVALGVAGVSLLPLRAAGRLLHGTSAATLAVALFPSLLAGLPLMGFEEDAPWLRALCAGAGVVALASSAWRSRKGGDGKVALVGAGAALYGALWLAVFAVASGPSGFDALEPGSPLFAGFCLWAMALASVVAFASTTDAMRATFARASPVLELVAHAVLASGAVVGAIAAFAVTPGEDRTVDLVSALTPAFAALVFFLLEPRRRALLHTAVLTALLAGVLCGRLVFPFDPGGWVLGGAVVASGLMLAARWRKENTTPRGQQLLWSIVASLAALPLVSWFGLPEGLWPRALTGLVIAFAAHASGGWRWRGLHYLGGLAGVLGVHALVAGTPSLAGSWGTLAVLAVASALYGVIGRVQALWAQPVGHRENDLLPLDDLSLVLAAVGVLLAIGAVPVTPEPLASMAAPLDRVLPFLPTALLAGILLPRTPRDRSRGVAFLAASALALLASQVAGTVSDYQSSRAALVAAGLTLGYALLAALRGPGATTAETPALRGRKFLGANWLPFPERGWPLFTDGFAAVAFIQAGIGALTLLQWLASPNDAERPQVLLAGALLTGAALVTFVSRGFVSWRLRGSVAALAVGGGFIALTAMANRAGRPLSPDVVASRLPLIGIALWALAVATRRFGPWLGRLLENPKQGAHYHFVPHAGVLALALVLLKGAYLVGMPSPSRALGVTPPLLVLGAAVLVLLLERSFRTVLLAHVGLLLGLGGAALWSARQSLLGPSLAALVPPDGQWVRASAMGPTLDWTEPAAWLAPGDTLFFLWQRALIGIAAAGLVYAGATFARLPEFHVRALRRWAVHAVALVCVAALFQPGLLAAGLVLTTGVTLFLGGGRSQGRGAVAMGLLLLVHAQAHQVATLESWPGPVLGLLGLLVVTVAPRVAKWRGLPEGAARVRSQQLAALYFGAALVYAFAVGGDTSPVLAVPRLLGELFEGLGGTWMVAPAVAITLALLAATLFVAAFQWKGALAAFVATAGTGVTGLASVAALMTFVAMRASRVGPWPGYGEQLFTRGADLALVTAACALVLHAARQWLRPRRADVASGLGAGRDAWLMGTGLLLSLLAVGGQAPAEALPQAIAAIGLAVLVALHCAWTEHTGRHVYFVQLSIVGVYALVRNLYAPGLRAEHDALFALALGFVLVGVTVLARRAGVRPVEAATRRFAALLPFGMALVLPSEATREAALLAGGSGLLYAALGAVERSRLFGAFAAAAANVALLVAALAFGLEGAEIYLAPLGLLLLMLSQLFASSLPRAARNLVRVLGGLLLYVPAAAKVALRVGEAPDGTYALVFGGVCLLGVVVGMLLQIRAYLALGTLFLTLDVVANLLHAGLRDHRVGFLVMTLAGLTLIGGRILATLKRQEWELLVRRVRIQLQGWD
ncbi:hypothetical protein LY474_24205 [Myxococcus stipitatus]|uniref:hypothetical protein n=1 Tax=Myxococcus stipitatus TaxID=83455 RepID=UPI001F24CB5D|nr:hypothetical protein [Myxococcus stipitatus]MCE9670916.1 hypothetical protein [Myxococcus stipitatus]